MVKLSILTFYYRVFVTPAFRRIVLGTITFIALWVLTITIVLALECRPIQKFWDPTVPGECFNLVAVSYFTNITNLVTDVWIFLLPIPVIWGLHMSNNKKLGLCGVFTIGLGFVLLSSSGFLATLKQLPYLFKFSHTDTGKPEHASLAPFESQSL